MKTRLIVALGSLATASLAQAAAVGLEWAGNTTSPIGAFYPGVPVTARFYILNGAAPFSQRPFIQAMGLQIDAWADAACTIRANMSIFQTAVSTPLAGWSVAPANNNADLNGLQFAAIAGPNTFFSQGKTYPLDIQLTCMDPTPLQTYYLTINRWGSALIDDTGADFMTNNSIWYSSGFETAGKSKWGFGNWGGGEWEQYDYDGPYPPPGQAANPLVMDLAPEPGGLIILLVGAAACLRRHGAARLVAV